MSGDKQMQGKVIHAWSGPRSLSTAMMYSFAQREDQCKVFDEPLYPQYLLANPEIFRPYRDELCDGATASCNDVLNDLNAEAMNHSVVYAKHMIKQMLPDIDKSLLFTPRSEHILLIQNPMDMILSWDVKSSNHGEGNVAGGDSTGLHSLVQLFIELRKKTGKVPVVIDVDMMLENPEHILGVMCAQLNIPYDSNQLSWPAGPKPNIDGLWAKYWYDYVHKTTGFQGSLEERGKPKRAYSKLSPEQLEVYREVLPFYEMLKSYAIGTDPMARGLSHCPKNEPVGDHPSTVIDHGKTLSSLQLTDPRNEHILCWVGDRLVPREYAKVSVFDSTVQGGDAVWEGCRVYGDPLKPNTGGRVYRFEEHTARMMDSARAMGFKNIPSKDYIRNAVIKTLQVNGMRFDTHFRMTLSRGGKASSSMNPMFNVFGCVLLIVPEWKPVGNAATYNNETGVKLITSAGRRNGPSCVDSKIHHCNLINNILPKIQANQGGAADALMLDDHGYVSETNATNIFMVKDGVVSTPTADYCLPGITRRTVISLVNGISKLPECCVRNISLAEMYAADEVFTTGSMGELTPVNEIDGRPIGYMYTDKTNIPVVSTAIAEAELDASCPWPVTKLLQKAYRQLTDTEGLPIP